MHIIAVHMALRPNTPGELKACTGQLKDRYVRQKLNQLKVLWSNVAMSARSYISSRLKGQMSPCAPETTPAQSSMVKRRYVRQKLQ